MNNAGYGKKRLSQMNRLKIRGIWDCLGYLQAQLRGGLLAADRFYFHHSGTNQSNCGVEFSQTCSKQTWISSAILYRSSLNRLSSSGSPKLEHNFLQTIDISYPGIVSFNSGTQYSIPHFRKHVIEHSRDAFGQFQR